MYKILAFFLFCLMFNGLSAQTPPYAIDPAATKTLPSGLKIQIVQPGTGPNAKPGDMVEVHYYGTLTNGSMFDNSIDRGRPFKFKLGIGQVIKGWDEGIALLNKGAKAILTIPSEMAYGAQDRPKIPANSVLIFHVELISITEGPKPFVPYAYKESDLKTTASGLKYYIVEPGKGDNAKPGQTVDVHYHGTLTNGKKFDSSFDRGEPFSFGLGRGQVIQGWDEGIALLNPGAKAVLVIPPHLGYGDRAMGDAIPANSTLVFYVQLMNAR